VLRVCRFYDEGPERMAIHRLYRGADVRDVASSCVRAVRRMGAPRFSLYNIAGPYCFQPSDVRELRRDAPAVVRRYFPRADAQFKERGWSLPQSIDRVYVSDAARRDLGYRPRHDFDDYMNGVVNVPS
jgi:UDP-glucose 4-epimerase